MASLIEWERIERTSRTSAVIMGLAAMIILFALLLSYYKLETTQSKVTSLQTTEEDLRRRNFELTDTIQKLQSSVSILTSEASLLRSQNAELTDISNVLREQIGALREALAASRNAIIAFHNRDYGTAVQYYDRSLQADPENAYLLNLKAYSLFKLKRIRDAIEVQRESIQIDPSYAWGYFDLARFLCAAGEFDDATKAIQMALTNRPALKETINNDGEFQRLCRHIL